MSLKDVFTCPERQKAWWGKKMLWKSYLLRGLLYSLGLGYQRGISMSWSPVRKTSFFFYFLLELRMPKFMIWRTCWHWYYHRPVRMLNCIHLSCQDYSSPEKHLVAMKNTLFTQWALESECQCCRRHLEEYNQHGVRRWWCQNWCRSFENHHLSPFFFRENGTSCKSRLVSRLRVFFFHLQNVSDDDKIEAFFSFPFLCRIFCLRLQNLPTVASRDHFFAEYHLFLFLFCDPEFFF